MRKKSRIYLLVIACLILGLSISGCFKFGGITSMETEDIELAESDVQTSPTALPPTATEDTDPDDLSKDDEPEPCIFAETWLSSAQWGAASIAENFGFLAENPVDKSIWVATTSYKPTGANKIILRRKERGSDTWDIAQTWTPPVDTYAEVTGILFDASGTLWIVAQQVDYPAWTNFKAVILKLPPEGIITAMTSKPAMPTKLGMRDNELWIAGELIFQHTLPHTIASGVIVYNTSTGTVSLRKSITYPDSQNYVIFQGDPVKAPNGKMWLPGSARDKGNIKHGIILEEIGETFKIIADFGEDNPDQQWNVTALAFDGDTFWATLAVNVLLGNTWTKEWRVGTGLVADPVASFVVHDDFRVIVPGMSATPSFIALHPNDTVFVMGLAKNLDSIKNGQVIQELWNSLVRSGTIDEFAQSDLFMPSDDQKFSNQAIDLLIDSNGNVWTSHMTMHSTNYLPGTVFVRKLACE